MTGHRGIEGLERFEQPCVRIGPEGGTIPLMPTDTGEYVRLSDVQALLTQQDKEAGELAERLRRWAEEILNNRRASQRDGELAGDLVAAVRFIEGDRDDREGCPDDPVCGTCPASHEDDVRLPHERAAHEAVLLSNRSGNDEQVEAGAVSEEAVEAAAAALHDEQEYRDPSGPNTDERWCPPGHDGEQEPPNEPFLWAQMVEEGKYPGTQEEFRKDARAALEAALPHLHPTPTPGLSEEERERLPGFEETVEIAERAGAGVTKLSVYVARSIREMFDLLHALADRSNQPDSSKAGATARENSQEEEQSDDKAVHHPPAVGGEAEEVTVSLSLEAAEKWAKSLRCLRLELPDAVWKDACEPYLTTLRAALASTQPQETDRG